MQHGFVVFRNVIDQPAKHSHGFYEFLERVCPTLATTSEEEDEEDDNNDRKDGAVATGCSCANEPPVATNGYFCDYGIAQTRFMWQLRNDVCLKVIFSILYKTKRLLTSFEGCRYIPLGGGCCSSNHHHPSSTTTQATRPKVLFRSCNIQDNLQRHILQPQYQALVQLEGGGDTGFYFIPKSHLQPMVDPSACVAAAAPSSILSVVQAHDFIWQKATQLVSLCGLQPGDVLLWNPLLVHGFSSSFLRSLQAFVSYSSSSSSVVDGVSVVAVNRAQRLMQLVQRITLPFHPLPQTHRHHPTQPQHKLMSFPPVDDNAFVDYDTMHSDELALLFGMVPVDVAAVGGGGVDVDIERLS
jgi:hypothetical protein